MYYHNYESGPPHFVLQLPPELVSELERCERSIRTIQEPGKALAYSGVRLASCFQDKKNPRRFRIHG